LPGSAIIVSRGRVVADGSLEEMRARTGQVRYIVTIDEKHTLSNGGAPNAQQVQEALASLGGLSKIVELPTDDTAHTFQAVGAQTADARAEIYRLAVQKGWLLLEMRRETQTLEDVFMSLTRGDERADRGRALLNDEEAEEAARELDEEEADDEDDEDDEDEGDEEEGDDESEVIAKAAKPSPTKPGAKPEPAPAPSKDADEDDDEDDDDDDGEEDSADEDDEDDDESDEEDEDDEEEDEHPAKPEKGKAAVSTKSKPLTKSLKKG